MNPTFSHDLTISLIVKNEADRLKSCLEALTPLRNALKCQLILTDTGSTDGTQDIAKEFADLYLEFDWCDDFAKARNHAIPHATGRWFFYLDADEVCDHSLEHIWNFLQTPESHTTGSLTVTQRNYQGDQKNLSHFSDCSVARLVNFGRGKRYFVSSIHESIPVHRHSPPLPVILHHDGYLSQQSKKKEGRNHKLLVKIIQEDPHGLQHYIPLIRECATPQDKQHWIHQAFSVVEESVQGTSHFAYPSLLLEQARWAEGEKNLPLLKDTLQLLERMPSLHNTLPHLELLGLLLGFSFQQSCPFQELLPLFSRYRTLFLALEETPDTQFPLISVFFYHTPLSYHRLELQMVDALKHSTLLEGGGSLLTPSKGYQIKNASGFYPLLPKTTFLSLELELYPKIEEILQFLKEEGATKDLMDVTQLLATHLKQKGQSPL